MTVTTTSLHAVRHPGAVTAAGALAWFASGQHAAPVTPVIGYLLAATRAEWFRCDGATTGDVAARGPDGPRDLGDAFEVFATDGTRQLRWRHVDSGTGTAVSLAEDTGQLPAGQALASDPERRRLEGTATRLLAGQVVAAMDGWATLATARYAPCDVPVTAPIGQEVWASLAEYVVTDEHGNVSVVDTLLLALEARTPAPAKERQA
jgi:hypothetical protein